MKFKIFYILAVLCLLMVFAGFVCAANETNDGVEIISSEGDTINVPSSVDVNSSKKAVISVESNHSVEKSDFTLHCDDKKIEEFNFSQNIISFEHDFESKSNLIINYKNVNHSVVLNRVYNAGFSVLNNSAEYFAGYFKFKVVDIDSGEVLGNKSVKITGKNENTSLNWINRTSDTGFTYDNFINCVSDDEGVILLKNYGFYPGDKPPKYIASPVGKYYFTLTGTGDLKGYESFECEIKKATINITIKAFKEYIGTKKDVIINVTNAATGEAVKGTRIDFYIPDTDNDYYYDTSDDNGLCNLHVDSLHAGVFKITATNNDTQNFNPANASSSFTILKKPITIKVSLVSTYYYNTGKIGSVEVKDKNTGKALYNISIRVKIGDLIKYYTTNKKGCFDIDAFTVGVGNYKMIINSNDGRYISDDIKRNVGVKKTSAKISVKKTIGYYKQRNAKLNIKLTNTKNKKAVFNAKMLVRIYFDNGRSYHYYYARTGLKGELIIYYDNLEPGKHKVVVQRDDKKNYTAKGVTSILTIKKAPVKFSAKKITAKKGTNKYFKVAVKNKKTKTTLLAGVKVKIKVYTGKTYKTFSAKTDSKGIAKLNVKKLKKGTHKVIVSRASTYITAKDLKTSIKII